MTPHYLINYHYDLKSLRTLKLDLDNLKRHLKYLNEKKYKSYINNEGNELK